MRRVFACSTSPKGKGGRLHPLDACAFEKHRRSIMSFFPSVYSLKVGRFWSFERIFASIDGEWDIFLSCNVSSRNTLHLHMGVNCFLSFSIKWIEIEEELIVSLVLNFWKRSWVVCCSSLFTEEALIGLEILVSSLHALFLILHRFEEYEWYL